MVTGSVPVYNLFQVHSYQTQIVLRYNSVTGQVATSTFTRKTYQNNLSKTSCLFAQELPKRKLIGFRSEFYLFGKGTRNSGHEMNLTLNGLKVPFLIRFLAQLTLSQRFQEPRPYDFPPIFSNRHYRRFQKANYTVEALFFHQKSCETSFSLDVKVMKWLQPARSSVQTQCTMNVKSFVRHFELVNQTQTLALDIPQRAFSKLG